VPVSIPGNLHVRDRGRNLKHRVRRSRYHTHEAITTPDGEPILKPNTITSSSGVIGTGPTRSWRIRRDYYEGIDALRAYKENLIDKDLYFTFCADQGEVSRVGVEDLNLRETTSWFRRTTEAAWSWMIKISRTPSVQFRVFEEEI